MTQHLYIRHFIAQSNHSLRNKNRGMQPQIAHPHTTTCVPTLDTNGGHAHAPTDRHSSGHTHLGNKPRQTGCIELRRDVARRVEVEAQFTHAATVNKVTAQSNSGVSVLSNESLCKVKRGRLKVNLSANENPNSDELTGVCKRAEGSGTATLHEVWADVESVGHTAVGRDHGSRDKERGGGARSHYTVAIGRGHESKGRQRLAREGRGEEGKGWRGRRGRRDNGK